MKKKKKKNNNNNNNNNKQYQTAIDTASEFWTSKSPHVGDVMLCIYLSPDSTWEVGHYQIRLFLTKDKGMMLIPLPLFLFKIIKAPNKLLYPL